MATLYLLHFDKPYWTNCQHYIGYTTVPLEERLTRHRNGNGSKLVRYALAKGIKFELAYREEYDTPQEARQAELRYKRSGHMRKRCLICRAIKHKGD